MTHSSDIRGEEYENKEWGGGRRLLDFLYVQDVETYRLKVLFWWCDN